MADISIEDLKKLNEVLRDSALGSFIEDVETGARKITDLSSIMGEFATTTRARLQSLVDSAESLVDKFGGFVPVLEKMGEVGRSMFSTMTDQVKEFAEGQKLAEGGTVELGAKALIMSDLYLGFIPKGITGMGEFGRSGYDAGQKISESFKNVSGVLGAVLSDKQLAFVERMAEGTSRAFEMQQGIAALAAAQGNLNLVMQEGRIDGQALHDSMVEMSDMAYNVAGATGQTMESVMGLAQEMGSIPDALSQPIEVQGAFINQLVLTSQVGKNFGVNQSEVAKTLSNAYTNVGLSGQEAFETISQLYASAGDSKLRFEPFTKTVMGIAESFKMLGDNTAAATNVVKTFDTAFKGSDISPAAMQKVIEGMTQGIEGMKRGTQAFISAQTGGPGGLAGAFEMELALQEGRMDEVLQRTMEAMQQQFGGQVLTLQDAARNQELAGEFYKQVQYLTQVAGIAGSDREAYRILEAMQSGATDMLRPGAAAEQGQQALAAAQEGGAAEQMRTSNILIETNRELERMKHLQMEQLSSMNDIYNASERMGDLIQMSNDIGMSSLAATEEARSFTAGSNRTSYAESLVERAKQNPVVESIVAAGRGSQGVANLAQGITIPPEAKAGLAADVGRAGAAAASGPERAASQHEVRVMIEASPEFNARIKNATNEAIDTEKSRAIRANGNGAG